MAHSHCTDAPAVIEVPAGDRRRLLQLARQSIAHGFHHGRPLRLAPQTPEGIAARPLGSFVTLTQQGALRGCTGSLAPTSPLAMGVCESAWRAAFADPRFAPLNRDEFARIHIEISVLSAPVPMNFTDEAALLAMLRPHKDGVIVEEGIQRATFLPKVWESLPEPRHFLAALKRKAGLDEDYWSDSLRVFSYAAVSFGEAAAATA